MAAKSKKESEGDQLDKMGRRIRHGKVSMTKEDVEKLALKLTQPSSNLMRVATDMEELQITEIKVAIGGIETNLEELLDKIATQFEAKILAASRKKGMRDRRNFE